MSELYTANEFEFCNATSNDGIEQKIEADVNKAFEVCVKVPLPVGVGQIIAPFTTFVKLLPKNHPTQCKCGHDGKNKIKSCLSNKPINLFTFPLELVTYFSKYCLIWIKHPPN